LTDFGIVDKLVRLFDIVYQSVDPFINPDAFDIPTTASIIGCFFNGFKAFFHPGLLITFPRPFPPPPSFPLAFFFLPLPCPNEAVEAAVLLPVSGSTAFAA
jgi:hypothetical protein